VKQKAGSLKKTNNIDKPLAHLTKTRKKNTHTIKLEMQKGR
jgi:hypothetical protein